MNFLYTLSNVCIPFALMLFETIKRDSEGLKPSYGKWLALFLLTFLFNGMTIFNRWWLTLFDLAIKCSLYFLPESINSTVEQHISSMHLEGYIENARNILVNSVFWLYQKSIWVVLTKLRPEEADQFRQALKNSLNSEQLRDTIGITAVPKILQSTGTNCTIISEAAVAQTLIKRQIQSRKGDIEKRVSPDSSRRSNSSKKMRPQKENSVQIEQIKTYKRYETKEIVKTQPQGFKTSRSGANENLGDSFHQLRQSSKIIAADLEDQQEPVKDKGPAKFTRHTDPEISKIKQRSKPTDNSRKIEKEPLENSKKEVKKIQKKIQKKEVKVEIERKEQKKLTDKQNPLKRRHTDISQIRGSFPSSSRQRSVSPQSKEQVQMLEKLDVSASEYSDMFEQDRDEDLEDEVTDEVKQVCRVEAIVQIGSAPNSKLEIYYLELYSNGDLRIMSLYGREFQKHRLVSMTKAQNSYYLLQLTGGAVNSRKIKFRGQHQPFMKYLQSV